MYLKEEEMVGRGRRRSMRREEGRERREGEKEEVRGCPHGVRRKTTKTE